MLKVCLVGSGGLGTIASLVLEKSKCATVTTVLRSNFEHVKRDGFEIDSVDHGKISGWKPMRIAASVEKATAYGPYDFVVVTMKTLPDLYSIPATIRPIVTSGTTSIVLIQNGLDIDKPLIEAFPACTVMSGISYIGSRVRGNVVFHEDPDKLIIGPHLHAGLSHSTQIEKTKQFVNLPQCWWPAKWRGNRHSTLLKPAMREMYKFGKAAGHDFTEEYLEQMLKASPPTTPFKPSMLVDLEKGNPLELDVILGPPLRYAKELKVDVPKLQMIYDLLKLVQWGILERRKNERR